MRILWGARFARMDLLRVVGFLATKITKWTSKCDRQLYRLIGYLKGSAGLRMVGWVGDSFDSITPHLHADADFAGCVETLRSTSGVHQALLWAAHKLPHCWAQQATRLCAPFNAGGRAGGDGLRGAQCGAAGALLMGGFDAQGAPSFRTRGHSGDARMCALWSEPDYAVLASHSSCIRSVVA